MKKRIRKPKQLILVGDKFKIDTFRDSEIGITYQPCCGMLAHFFTKNRLNELHKWLGQAIAYLEQDKKK